MTLMLPDFQARGACRDHDPELFFPVSEAAANAAQIERAKAVCADCPVIAACRAFALDHGAEGIWGGMTEDERRAVRARENRAVAAAQADTGQGDAEQPVGEDTSQQESSPTLPSYETARQHLTRTRGHLARVQRTGGNPDAVSRAEQRVAAAERQFAAVRARSASGAVA